MIRLVQRVASKRAGASMVEIASGRQCGKVVANRTLILPEERLPTPSSRRYFRDQLWRSLKEEFNPSPNAEQQTIRLERRRRTKTSTMNTANFDGKELEIVGLIQKRKFQDAFNKIQAILQNNATQPKLNARVNGQVNGYINGDRDTVKIHNLHPSLWKEFLTALAKYTDQYPNGAALADNLLQLQHASPEGRNHCHYGLVLRAWAKSGLPDAGNRAWATLQDAMAHSMVPSDEELARNYREVIKAYANAKQFDKAEEILTSMTNANDSHYEVLIKSQLQVNNVQEALRLIQQANQNDFSLSNTPLNWVLQWYSERALQEPQMVSLMETFYHQVVTSPDQNSFTHRLKAYANARDPVGAETAFQEILLATQENNSSTAPLLTKHLNSVLKAWMRSKAPQKFERVLEIMQSIQEASRNTLALELDEYSYYTVLIQCAEEGRAKEATRVFQILELDYQTGNPKAKPTLKLFGLWIKAMAKYGDKNAGPQSELILEKLQQEYGLTPDAAIFASMRNCWMITKQKQRDHSQAYARIGELNQLIQQADLEKQQQQQQQQPKDRNSRLHGTTRNGRTANVRVPTK